MDAKGGEIVVVAIPQASAGTAAASDLGGLRVILESRGGTGLNGWRAAASLLMRRHLISRALQAPAFEQLNPHARQHRRPQNLRPGDAAATAGGGGPQAGSAAAPGQRRHADQRRRPDRGTAAAGGYQSPGAAGAGGLQLVQSPGGIALSRCPYGPDHPEVAIDLSYLAQLLEVTSRLEEAESMYSKVVDIIIRVSA